MTLFAVIQTAPSVMEGPLMALAIGLTGLCLTLLLVAAYLAQVIRAEIERERRAVHRFLTERARDELEVPHRRDLQNLADAISYGAHKSPSRGGVDAQAR